MHTHFLSQTTPKKRVGKLPILIGNYKGKIWFQQTDSTTQR